MLFHSSRLNDHPKVEREKGLPGSQPLHTTHHSYREHACLCKEATSHSLVSPTMVDNKNLPLAKRSPSILVTDVRNAPSGGRSAPFVKAPKRKGPLTNDRQGDNGFSKISMDSILMDTGGDIPSAYNRGGRASSLRGATNDVNNSPSFPGKEYLGRLKSTPRKAASATQARFMPQNIPPRTSKMSEKLVLIPDEDIVYDHGDFSVEAEFSPPRPWDTEEEDVPKRTYAERLPKDRRTEKFSRVTAYCLSDGMRLQKTAEFLREHHKIRPRIYDEALFAPYFLPLLPGDGEGSRVKSSPGGIQIMEQMINQSEQGDHHYEYFSGLETPRNVHQSSGANGGDEFDPSEPQDFSPRVTTDMTTGGIHSPDARYKTSLASNPSSSPTENRPSTSPEMDSTTRKLVSAAQKKHNPHTDLRHAELFIFSYGVIVFWNFSEHQEKDIIADLTFARVDGGSRQSLVVRPIQDVDIETEEMHFTYCNKTTRPRIYNDMITLRSGDHMIKLAMSHAIAQSTKLSRFEARMDTTMHDVKHVPKMLALTGKLGMRREEVLKISGKLFKLRVDVNLSSNVLDTPEFFWEAEPSLNPLYAAVREYLEIEGRILVLNEKCKVFLELTDIISDSIAEYNMSRITWIIIILICLSLGVSTVEIAVRFVILSGRS